MADARFRVDEDGAMVKNAGGKNGYRSEGLSMCLGTEICRKRELANIEFRTPHHLAECLNQNGDVLIFNLKTLGLDRPIPKRLGVSKRTKNSFKHAYGVRGLITQIVVQFGRIRRLTYRTVDKRVIDTHTMTPFEAHDRPLAHRISQRLFAGDAAKNHCTSGGVHRV